MTVAEAARWACGPEAHALANMDPRGTYTGSAKLLHRVGWVRHVIDGGVHYQCHRPMGSGWTWDAESCQWIQG